MSQPPPDLRVLTFNLWGIFNSKMCKERMARFASKVEHYDIILLQEQFDPEDFALIESLVPEHVRKTRYFRRFPSGFYGSGCAVISRFPITSAFFHTYPLQGYPEMVLHGDFFANKGAALVKVSVPLERDGAIVNQEVILYTTHLVAVYQKVSQMSSWKKERYLPYRISQSISLAHFIMSTSKPTDYIIIGGDFNSSQRSLEVQMMLILLKRKGYDLRSVLPTPGNLLEQARTEEQAEQARSLFTYSYRNAFNASKTSYFKLLKLEADIPSQIDHIFFNCAAFTLKSFEDCPDVSPTFPSEIDANGDGRKVPTGVVVFTKNEVKRSRAPSLAERWADVLRRRCRNNRHSALYRIANVISKPRKEAPAMPSSGDASHLSGQAFDADDTSCFPISDHYGVACRLEMHPRSSNLPESNTPSDDEAWQHVSPPTTIAAASGATAIPLTADELLVVNNVERFLAGFVTKLRYQVKASRVMSAVSMSIVALNIWALRRLAAAQEQRTLTTLRRLYQLACENAASSKKTEPTAQQKTGRASVGDVPFTEKLQYTTSQIVSKTVQWTTKALDVVGVHIDSAGQSKAAVPQKSGEDSTAVSAVVGAMGDPAVPDFYLLTKELLMRPFWATVDISAAVTIVGSVMSVSALVIGMFQRGGNARILAEQVRLINPSLQPAHDERRKD